MNPDTTPILTFVGLSGTGKTTFLEQLIPVLKARGHRLAVLKHDVHHFEMDKPGKDTWRFTQAGADAVAISGKEKFAMIEQPARELSFRESIQRLPEADLILTEGYKQNRCPKIEIHRAALHRPLLAKPEELLLVMTDEPLPDAVPQLPLEDVAGCADAVERYMQEFYAAQKTLPAQGPILVSACLLGVCCKYSGGHNYSPAVAALAQRYSLIPMCPEQLGGLPTPRPPAERSGDRVLAVSGQDVTDAYRRGAAEALRLARTFGCTAAILKARSPACGSGAIYDGTFTGTLTPGDGAAAALLRKNGLRVLTEEDLP